MNTSALLAKLSESLSGQLYLRRYSSDDGETACIYGDPEGLRSLARKLNDLADLNQDHLAASQLPSREGFHVHCSIKNHWPEGSMNLDLGRLDAKADGDTSWFRV